MTHCRLDRVVSNSRMIVGIATLRTVLSTTMTTVATSVMVSVSHCCGLMWDASPPDASSEARGTAPSIASMCHHLPALGPYWSR